nr:hypothetical protein [uncultured Psychroserpens sp.]
MEKFRIEIKGNWSVTDFQSLTSALDYLYESVLTGYLFSKEYEINSFSSYYHNGEDLMEELLSYWINKIGHKDVIFLDRGRMRRLLRKEFPYDEKNEYLAPLKLVQIQYASPGFGDFAGLGAIVGHLKDILLRLMDSRESKRHRDNRYHKERLENLALELEISKELYNHLSRIGFEGEELRKLWQNDAKHLSELSRLISEDKIEKIS